MASTELHAAPGYVLIELGGYYSNIPVPNQKHNTHTNGICIESDDHPKWLGNRLFWEEYQASSIIEQNGKQYCFIKVEDVRGYEVNQKTN